MKITISVNIYYENSNNIDSLTKSIEADRDVMELIDWEAIGKSMISKGLQECQSVNPLVCIEIQIPRDEGSFPVRVKFQLKFPRELSEKIDWAQISDGLIQCALKEHDQLATCG